MTGIALGWIAPTSGICIRRQKSNQLMLALDRIGLGAASAMPTRPNPGKKASGRTSLSANQVGLLRGLVSAYSQKELNGTTQRFSGLSHGDVAHRARPFDDGGLR